MKDNIKLNDIADELLILNKKTIDSLFKLDNCSDCIALYLFYYKTAKWQKTNTIKANDTYVKKSLKWGNDKIRKTKQTLKENGLIVVTQKRENNKIQGWYIELSYIVSQNKLENINIKVDEKEYTNNTQNQQLLNPTSRNEDTNALKEYIKCLKKEIEVLKGEKTNPTLEEVKEYCLKRNKGVDAKKFYDYYNEAGWLDKNGKPVKNWKQKMIANWEKTNNNDKEESIDDRLKKVYEYIKNS